jgi:hypothetical protein
MKTRYFKLDDGTEAMVSPCIKCGGKDLKLAHHKIDLGDTLWATALVAGIVDTEKIPKSTYDMYEVICLKDESHKGIPSKSQKEAVEAWNREYYSQKAIRVLTGVSLAIICYFILSAWW